MILLELVRKLGKAFGGIFVSDFFHAFRSVELVQKTSVHFSYLGALRTARPTYDLSNLVGKACPQAAAKNSFLYPPTRCGHTLDPAFYLS